MNIEKTALSKPPYFSSKVSRTLVLLGFAVLLGGALLVPFYYETQTLWYKMGGDKLMLRAGQLAGLLALVFCSPKSSWPCGQNLSRNSLARPR